MVLWLAGIWRDGLGMCDEEMERFAGEVGYAALYSQPRRFSSVASESSLAIKVVILIFEICASLGM